MRSSPLPCPRGRAGWGFFLLLTLSSFAHALDIERSSATYADKHYRYELVAVLDAPLDRVRSVLLDYEHYTQLDPRILEARVIERLHSDVRVLRTKLRACFGPFCRNVDRVERVEESSLGLTAKADPKRSDVKFGETTVALSALDGRTRVDYRTDIVPDFWIPLFPGRRWMLRTLEKSTTDLFRGIERTAAPPPQPQLKATSLLPLAGEGQDEGR